MKNPPAFQFYPQDFISDLNVVAMTDEEVGRYIKLLCHCWIEDGLSIGSPLVDKWLKQSPTVIRCFVKKGGKYRNPRLDKERDKQRSWAEKSSKGGLQSAKSKRNEPKSNLVQPNANQRGTLQSSSSYIRDKNTSYLFLAELLKERVKVNVPFQKISDGAIESWANDFRLMVENDKIPVEKVQAVLDWATKDSFWKLQIRSADNFRKQFGQLEAKSRATDPRQEYIDREKRVGARPDNGGEDKAAKDAMAARRDLRVKLTQERQPKIDAARAASDKKAYETIMAGIDQAVVDHFRQEEQP